MSKLHQELDETIRAKDAEIFEFREISSTELRDRDQKLEELQRKALKYLKECELKTVQLEEAQKLKTRLLMALGLDNGEAVLSRSTFETTEEKAPPQSRQIHRTRRSKPQIETLAARETTEYEDSESEASVASSASSHGALTPKRVKQRTSYTTFKIPSARQPETNLRHEPSLAVRKRYSTGREPLVEASTGALNFKSGVRRKSEFVNASKIRSIDADGDHHMIENKPLHGEFGRHRKSGRASPVKGVQDVAERHDAKEENEDFAELVTQDFEGTTVEF